MTSHHDPAAVGELVAYLRDQSNAEPAATFPRRLADVDHPGLYAWWADEIALAMLSESLGTSLEPLIYAGQAGATSTRTKTEYSATLRSRIVGNHLRGNLRSSTFRKTISAVLLQPLDLQLTDPNKLSPTSNSVISEWIRRHLQVATAPVEDRATLAHLERQILQHLDAPLNLEGMHPTPTRLRLTHLRTRLRHGP